MLPNYCSSGELGIGRGVYFNANSCKGEALGSQFREGCRARTKKDFIFLLLLKDNIGSGIFLCLNEFSSFR